LALIEFTKNANPIMFIDSSTAIYIELT
jgi:hypothetical protein